jgi:hypothetical protein
MWLAQSATAASDSRWDIYGAMHPNPMDSTNLTACSLNTVFGSPQIPTAAAVRAWLDDWHTKGLGAILAFGSSYLKSPGQGTFVPGALTNFWQPILGGATNADIRTHPALRGVMVLDEPYDASNWGGTRLEKTDLMGIYQDFKSIAPGVPLGMGMGDAGVFAYYGFTNTPAGVFMDFGSFTFTLRKDQLFGGFINYMADGRQTSLAAWTNAQPGLRIYLMPQSYGSTDATPPVPMPPAAWIGQVLTNAANYTIHGIIFNSWRNQKYTDTLGAQVAAEFASGGPGAYAQMLANGAAMMGHGPIVAPSITHAAITNGTLTFRFQAQAAVAYTVQHRDLVELGTWVTLTNISPPSELTTVFISVPQDGMNRFFESPHPEPPRRISTRARRASHTAAARCFWRRPTARSWMATLVIRPLHHHRRQW